MENFKLKIEQQEKIRPATIRLEIFRHDDKGSNTTADPNEDVDKTLPLSKTGRKHASENGKNKNPHPETAIAYGSLRHRTIETAERQLLAHETFVKEDLSLDEINKLIGDKLRIGKKYKNTELLDFNFNGSDQFREATADHFVNKKDLLVWYLEQSDQLVENEKDQISTSYSRLAGNVATLVSKYFDAYSKWKKIVSDNPDKYNKYDNELQRFMGTHQGVAESFLMKVIEKTNGKKEVYNFINSLKSKNGFEFGEGYSLVISETKNNNNELTKIMSVNFNDKKILFDKEVLEEIIKDKEDLDQKLRQV